MSDAAVLVEGLTKAYGDEVLAVDDLTLRVERGAVFGLLGPNGAGKTTTLRMLLGLVRPSAGRAYLLGEPVRPGASVLERVGALVESPGFVPHLSGLANLQLYWESGRHPLSDARLEEALAVAQLGTAIHRKVRTYSHGMRQRLGLAQALLGQPRLVVLDEPTNGLDPAQMREIRELVRRLADDGTTVFLSSHLLAEVEQVCTSAAVMVRGRLVATGTVDELTGSTGTVYLEVGDRARARTVLSELAAVRSVDDEHDGLLVRLDGVPASALVARLVAADVAVEQVVTRRHLEEVYLDLVEGSPR